MNKVNGLIKTIYEYIGDPIDYAELIGSPVPSTYGIRYTYEDPGDILLSEAAELLRNLSGELEQVKKERDAALTDLWNMCSCKKCKHIGSSATDDSKCTDCWLGTIPGHPELSHRTNWEWRGPCKENGGTE